MQISRSALWVSAFSLALLPVLMSLLGLGLTSATEVVIFAMACMALNVLVGFTGLVSFGHGAWFGLAAYAAALAQLHWFEKVFGYPLVLVCFSFLLLAWDSGF